MMKDPQNRGIIIAPLRASDYIFGDTSPILIPDRNIKDWTPYIPAFETQRTIYADMQNCLTFSGIHAIEMQINADIALGKYKDEALAYFKMNGFMQDGKFRASPRFSAKKNGTTEIGNYFNIVGDGFRHFGLLSEKDWPGNPYMWFADYYSEIPQKLSDKAKGILEYINIQYHFLQNQADIPNVLSSAPVQVGTAICAGWDSGNTVQACSGNIQHATVVFALDNNGYSNLDQYPPYFQKLASNYQLPIVCQYISVPKTLGTLSKGSKGARVSFVQSMIGANVDGNFGPNTEHLVMTFQYDNGLVADGKVGPRTMAALLKKI